jgi:Leucine-rich repeat (LRR) protein
MELPRKFDKLRILSLQSNRLTQWSDFTNCPALEEIYLSHNKLTDPADAVIATLPPTLTNLDVANNKLTYVPKFILAESCGLVELWLNDNVISDFESLDYLKFAPKLETVYLEKNLVQSQVPLEYTKKVRRLCPRLQQLDAVSIVGLKITENVHADVKPILKQW